MKVDYLVVGSGLTGAVIARTLADAGREVLVVERREHLGGNVHDALHPSGVRVHTYGPHYFRTSSDRIWDFVRRFAEFYPYEARVMTRVEGRLVSWPLGTDTLADLLGEGWAPAYEEEPANFEEASLAMMPRKAYELFVEGYTRKQWGVDPATLEAGLARRFDVRMDNDPRLMTKKHQGLPRGGYEALMKNLLAGIPVRTGWDFLERKSEIGHRRHLVFTGPIDEYFGFSLGRLRYRSQRRTHEHHPDVDEAQPCGQVNNPHPRDGDHIRTIEWKHMMEPGEREGVRGTVLTTEVPFDPDNPDAFEYPFPSSDNRERYGEYRRLAEGEKNTLICGRLGEYRYYDMDQAIARSLHLAEGLLD